MNITASGTSVLLGNTLSFSASVSNTTNTAVQWSVNNVAGGDSQFGTISASGLYTAPGILPSPAAVTIQAASEADPTKTATATITIISDVSVTISPPTAPVELGAQQTFQAVVASAGNPNPGVVWSLSGAGCLSSGCGSVSSNGVFTAPSIVPVPPSETVTATSVADPSRKATATITVTSNFSFTLTGPSSVAAGSNATFTATLMPIPNSNPDLALSWSVAGAGCSGAACGTIAPFGTGATASYIAPAVVPSPDVVTVTATPQAAPVKAASVTVTITSGSPVTVTLSPAMATLSIGNRETFTAQIQNSSDQTVLWSVNGISGGSVTLGQVCVTGSNPCQAVTAGVAGSVDYVAPAGVPSPNPVTLSAVSQSSPTASASSSITILPHVIVSISPPSATLAPNATQGFTAVVAGTTDQQVIWTISGAACTASGSPCGTIDPTGLYQAPPTAPSPNSFSVVATSGVDSNQSASATVTITALPTILSLLPSSITAGAAGGFTLAVDGANFVSSTPGPGSSILINGAARSTACTASNCTTLLSSSDVAVAGDLSVAVENPGGVLSNTVSFVVAPPATAPSNLALTPGSPGATGINITVTDLSTNGSSLPLEDVSLTFAAIGPFAPSTNTCTLNAGAVPLTIPTSGQASASICAFSVSGLSPSYLYSISGPAPNDMSIVGEAPLGLGIVDLTLQLGNTTATGARTLFVQDSSLDVASATGAVDVQ